MIRMVCFERWRMVNAQSTGLAADRVTAFSAIPLIGRIIISLTNLF